jgi:iron complex transport system substrate-binding protein
MRSLQSRLAGVLGAAALVLAGTACGGTSEEPAAATGVTIEHKYGATTIKGQPKRVVVVGLEEQDALLALGIVPVGTTKWLSAYPGEIGPWAKPKLGKAAVPTVLDATDGVQFERVAKLRPDLILGLYSGLTKADYDKLSRLAPTVAQPKGLPDYGVSWQELTKTVGKAVGKPEQADQLVASVEQRFAQARKEHPEFAGKTALMATPYEGIFVYGTEDNRSRALTSLGFQLPKDLDKLIGDQFGANISKERTDLLDTDALVWLVEDPVKDKQKLQGDKLYGDLNVAKQGRDIYISVSSDYGNATSFVSVLSLPYLLDGLVPQLTAAADGNPATKVPADS